MERIARISKIAFRATVVLFALAGFLLVAVFFAVKWGLTNVRGGVDFNDRILTRPIGRMGGDKTVSASANLCRALIVSSVFPQNGGDILKAIRSGAKDEIVREMIRAMELKVIALKPSAVKEFSNCDTIQFSTINENGFEWMNSEQWKVFEEAVIKDEPIIKKVSEETGVDERTIVGVLVGEQLRLFNSDRETFKAFFAPLKILGNETQFSLGVTGVKEETAKRIEMNLKDRNSEFYLGPGFENILDFKTDDHDTERVERLTAKDHYYSYLYSAIFIKEIERQWERKGYDITKRPEILGTIFNIGFHASKPNSDPKVGGAVIKIGDKSYTFGGLIYDFYYSGRLVEVFPYK